MLKVTCKFGENEEVVYDNILDVYVTLDGDSVTKAYVCMMTRDTTGRRIYPHVYRKPVSVKVEEMDSRD